MIHDSNFLPFTQPGWLGNFPLPPRFGLPACGQNVLQSTRRRPMEVLEKH